MKRKLIRHGNSSLSVTLPRLWVKKYNLKNADEVEMLIQGQKLVVSTESYLSGDRYSVVFTRNHAPIIRTFLASIHEYGFDEIEIFYDTEEIHQIIRYEQNLLLGFELMEHSEGRCLLKSISMGLPAEFDNIVKRLAQVTLTLSRLTLEKLVKGDLKTIQDILSLEETNNKLSDYCLRTLNKSGYRQPKLTSFIYVACWQLEKIADDYRNMMVLIMDTERHSIIGSNTLRLLEKVNQCLEGYLRLFTYFDMDKLSELKSIKGKLMRSLIASLQKSSDLVAICAMIQILNRVNDLSSSCIAYELERTGNR
jgi:phosphate uptake regulator